MKLQETVLQPITGHDKYHVTLRLEVLGNSERKGPTVQCRSTYARDVKMSGSASKQVTVRMTTRINQSDRLVQVKCSVISQSDRLVQVM